MPMMYAETLSCSVLNGITRKRDNKKPELPQKRPFRVFCGNSGNLVSRIRIRGSVVNLLFSVFQNSCSICPHPVRRGAALVFLILHGNGYDCSAMRALDRYSSLCIQSHIEQTPSAAAVYGHCFILFPAFLHPSATALLTCHKDNGCYRSHNVTGRQRNAAVQTLQNGWRPCLFP